MALVIRPDSGSPTEVVPKVLDILGEQFGYTYNAKGAKVLHPKVRVIQGDGIDVNSLGDILTAAGNAGWSADNLAFGSGGGLLQKVNRDTAKFAFKCSAIQVHGKWRDVRKDPVTDQGKSSKAGRLSLRQMRDGQFATFPESIVIKGCDDRLVTVFEDGEVKQAWSLAEIRERAAL